MISERRRAEDQIRIEGLLICIVEELQGIARILRAAPMLLPEAAANERGNTISDAHLLWAQSYASDAVFARSLSAFSPVALAIRKLRGEERNHHALCLARKVRDVLRRMPVHTFEVQNKVTPGTIQRWCARLLGKNPLVVVNDPAISDRLQETFGDVFGK